MEGLVRQRTRLTTQYPSLRVSVANVPLEVVDESAGERCRVLAEIAVYAFACIDSEKHLEAPIAVAASGQA